MNQPDPAVLARLYGATPTAVDIVLQSLYARREHLDVLIALVECEQIMHSGRAPPSNGHRE
jgi:hypothetical protein